MSFLKRLGRMIIDLATSKKAAAAIGALAAGVDPKVVIASYIVGQGIDDHGQGAKGPDGRRLGPLHTDAELADQLARVRASLPAPVTKP